MSYDKAIIQDILSQLHEAIERIEEWNHTISSADDYTFSPEGMKTLAATCMLIEAIGEGINKIDRRTDGKLLYAVCPQIPWKDIIGMRNHIAHGYFDIDADFIYSAISMDLPPLREALASISRHIEENTSSQV